MCIEIQIYEIKRRLSQRNCIVEVVKMLLRHKVRLHVQRESDREGVEGGSKRGKLKCLKKKN